MVMTNTCRFQKPGPECLILGAITSTRHYTQISICEEHCKGGTGDSNIEMYLLKRFGRRFVISNLITNKRISECMRARGLAFHLSTGDWLSTDKPKPPEPVRVKPPVTTMLKNLTEAALATSKKFIVDTADGGIWAGFQGIVACKKQANMRWDKCQKCPGDHLEKTSEEIVALGPKLKHDRWRCMSFPGGEEGCGCFLPAKTWVAASRCDKGYWDVIDIQFTEEPKSKETQS